MLQKYVFLLCTLATATISGCADYNTKEFFFGSKLGPDPFVIGSILSPLKTDPSKTNNEPNSNQTRLGLPKPQAILPPSQMSSRAKKASKILNLNIEQNTPSKQKNIVLSQILPEATGSIEQPQTPSQSLNAVHRISSSGKAIDFQEFDTAMQTTYKSQENQGYLLSKILGKNQSIDPTTREKLKEQKQ